jgi:hypothetical protein
VSELSLIGCGWLASLRVKSKGGQLILMNRPIDGVLKEATEKIHSARGSEIAAEIMLVARSFPLGKAAVNKK